MREEVTITEYEYDEEGRVTKKKVTRTEKGQNPHPFKTYWKLDDNGDDYGLI